MKFLKVYMKSAYEHLTDTKQDRCGLEQETRGALEEVTDMGDTDPS